MTTKELQQAQNDVKEHLEHLIEQQQMATPEEYDEFEAAIAADQAELERLQEAFDYLSEEAA